MARMESRSCGKAWLYGCGNRIHIRHPGRGYPRHVGDGKLMVIGRGQGERFIRVVYVIEDGGPIFVIHAMPVTTRRRKGGR